MKTITKNLFKLSVLEADYLNNTQNKIELVGCKYDEKKCEPVIAAINDGYNEAARLRDDKEFVRAINVLKSTFNRTFDIRDKKCSKCSDFFRTVITDNLVDMHSELKKMSTGIFKSKRFIASYVMAGEVLEDFNNAIMSEKMVVNKGEKKHQLIHYDRKVS